MENIKRPAKSETDDDLLAQQELFLKKQGRPSAQFSSSNEEKSVQEKITEVSDTEQLDTDIGDQNLEDQTEDVIFNIQEHDVSFSKPFVFQAPVLDKVDVSKFIKKAKTSKFAAQRNAQNIFMQLVNSEENQNEDNDESESGCVLIDGSGLMSEKEKKKIHEDNLAKLSAMSKEEILHHQLQLKNFLKPEVVNFIQKKKAMKSAVVSKKEENHLQRNVTKGVQNCLKGKDLGEVLRKEGREDCDALILEKALHSETNEVNLQQQNKHVGRADSKSNFEVPLETKELLKKSDRGLWRNMNKIEKEKLEWMTNLPQPKPIDLKTGYTARFDFEGKLVAREADIPTYKGLHHHGEEPEVPGYSLEELFLLARSSLQSQRITALNTIAHILENNWYGMLDSCFDAPLLPLVLNAGIVPLLRWALDDISITSVAATISAMHSLLISKADEACLQKTFCWLNGHFVPQLEPQGLDEPNIVLEELTDADLIKLDVVKGFLRIDILPRFMYILKVLCPPPLVCKLIIEICARLAQHSPESALKVAEHPGLLNLIIDKFLPLTWQFVDSSTLTDTANYQSPLPSALKFIRIIASTNKNMAIYVGEKYNIISNIICYLAVQPCDKKLSAQDTQLLAIETLKLWHTFLCYGMATRVFFDVLPMFLKQLAFCLSLDLNGDLQKFIKDFDYASHLFKAFEAVAVVIPEENINRNSQLAAVNVIFQKSVICLKKWLWQFSQEKVSSQAMTLLASCMNFVVTFCRKTHEGLTCEDWEPCSSAKEVFEEYVVTAMKSSIFQNLLNDFRLFSLYLSSEISGNKRDGKTIVSLGSVLYRDDIVPILREGTPLPLLSAVLNYTSLYKSFFNNNGNEYLELLFHTSIINYLQSVSKKEVKRSCWFLRFEIYFIYQLIQLASFIPSKLSLCHETAIAILTAFTSSEECIVEELFENIIFNQNAIPKMTSLFQTFKFNENNSLYSIASRLPVIAQCYVSCFLNESDISKSRGKLHWNSNLDTLFCLSSSNALVQKDWLFSPIAKLYQLMKIRKGEELSPEEILQLTSCLQWIYMCHTLDLPLVQEIPASAEIYYLCQVFLIDENLFKDEKIKVLLWNSISIILKKKTLNLCKINYNNIKTFDDIFLDMLIQYEAVSYGDEIFGSFLVLPLQQSCRSHWKKLLLTEHSSILTFLRIPLKKLLVPLVNYLEPIEMDKDVLKEYFKALGAGSLNYRRCPLLYVMAVHHIHHFIFLKSDLHLKFQKELLSNVLRLRKDLKRKILLYIKTNENEECGLSMEEELSSENQSHINRIMGMPVNI